jgi:tetratricopeptide (TPR) repeat protein
MILTEAQRPQPGEFHYRRVIELTRARDPIVLANLAWNLKGQGRLAEARQLYEESVEAEPNVFQTWFGWGQLEEADGNFAAARSRLDRAARIRPNDPGLRVPNLRLIRTGVRIALAQLRGPTPMYFWRKVGSWTGCSATTRPSPASTRRSDERAKRRERAISIGKRAR